MIPQSTIDEAISRLVKVYNPLVIYLYGDYAWGTPNEESTYDMLIVVESSEERSIRRSYAGSEMLLGLRMSKSISVFTKDEFDKYASDPTSTTHEIKTRGKVIYART